MNVSQHFYLAWMKSRKSYCTTPAVGVSKMLKFYVKVFCVMGKALSGELSCPCDRSCFYNSSFFDILLQLYSLLQMERREEASKGRAEETRSRIFIFWAAS